MNGYTNLTPAKFNPLSLQEIMMVPLARQKQHEEQEAKINELGINLNSLAQDRDYYNSKINEFQTEQDKYIDELSERGVSKSLTKNLTGLSRKRRDFLANDGAKIQDAYDQHQALVKRIMDIPEDKMNMANKQAYINQSLKDYQGVKAGGSYTPFYGANDYDGLTESLKFADEITPQTLKNYLLDSKTGKINQIGGEWGVGSVGNIPEFIKNNYESIIKNPNKIRKLVSFKLNSDPNFNAYINAQAKVMGVDPNKYKESLVTQYADAAAIAKSQKDLSVDQDIKNLPAEYYNSENPNDEPSPEYIELIETPRGGMIQEMIETGGLWNSIIGGNSPIEDALDAKIVLAEKLKTNISDEEKAGLRKEMAIVDETISYARKKVNEKLKYRLEDIVKNAKNNHGSYATAGEEKIDIENLQKAVEEGFFAGSKGSYILDSVGNSKNIYKVNDVMGIKSSTYIGTMSNEDIEKVRIYNEELNRTLKEDDVMPIQGLMIASDSGKKGDKLNQSISNNLTRAIKTGNFDNQKTDEIKDALSEFKQYGSSAKMLGFGRMGDSVFLDVELPVENGKKKQVQLELGDLSKTNGKLPTIAQNIIDGIKKDGSPEAVKAIQSFENSIRFKNIVPDMNYDGNNKVDYYPDQTNMYMQQFQSLNLPDSNGNRFISPISQTIRTLDVQKGDGVRIIKPNQIMLSNLIGKKSNTMIPSIDENKINSNLIIPSNALALSYKKNGVEKYYNFGDMYESWKSYAPNVDPKRLGAEMLTDILDGTIVNPWNFELVPVKRDENNNPIQDIFEAQDQSNPAFPFTKEGELKEWAKNMPIFSTEKSTLIRI